MEKKPNFKCMQDVDLKTVDVNTLVDIQTVQIDPLRTQQERLADFITQIKNPYCFRYGKTVVKISFANTDITFEDRMKSFFNTL